MDTAIAQRPLSPHKSFKRIKNDTNPAGVFGRNKKKLLCFGK